MSDIKDIHEEIKNIDYCQELDYLMSLGYSKEEAEDIIEQNESVGD